MLPTISERRLHDAPYAAHQQQYPPMDRDDERRDWRYAAPSARPVYAYEDAASSAHGHDQRHNHDQGPAPLPPLRSTLSYRDDDSWNQRGPPPAAPPAPVPSHSRQRLDLFAHLPLSSSIASSNGGLLRGNARVQMLDDNANMGEDDDDDHYRHYNGAAARAYESHHGVMLHDHGANAASGGTNASAAAAAAAKRRSRRMSNSERGKLYRSRRKEYVETLEDEVEALKQQLEEMRVKSPSGPSDQTARPSSPYDTLAMSRDRSRAGLARIVCEYFSLFQHGMPVTPMRETESAGAAGLAQLQTGSPTHQLQISHSPRMLSFIQTLMDPNMRFGDNFGVQMLLEQWQRYSAYHSSLQYDLNSIEVVSNETSPLISATATLRVRFSRTTIEKVFPHVLWNEPLVQRLIGLEVEYPVGNKFYFGPDGKIKRYETEVDFVGAFVKALGNVRDAMQVVGNALIKEQHRIGDDDSDATSARAYGASHSGSRSPTGSAASSHSSSSHSRAHSHSPDLSSSAEPLQRPRFKQSEARKTEEVYDDYSPQHGSRRMETDARTVNHGYHDRGEPSRTFARSAGEPQYPHPAYTANAHEGHHQRPVYERDPYHGSMDRGSSSSGHSRQHDPAGAQHSER